MRASVLSLRGLVGFLHPTILAQVPGPATQLPFAYTADMRAGSSPHRPAAHNDLRFREVWDDILKLLSDYFNPQLFEEVPTLTVT
jgi:hypothetical protein